MANPSSEDFSKLRFQFDGDDQFMRGSSVALPARSGHNARVAMIPDSDPWALDDKQVRQVLLRAFPNMHSNPTQRKRAALWMLVIQYYFRGDSGMVETVGGIAQLLLATKSRKKFGPVKHPDRRRTIEQEEKRVENIIRRIRLTAKGLRTDGKQRTPKTKLIKF